MVLLKVLTGKMAGTEAVARHFPFRVGRAVRADLSIEGHGVWDRHCEIQWQRGEGLALRATSGAMTLVNGQVVTTARLRHGDLIQLGELRMQFWLSPAQQAGLKLREFLTWLGVAAVIAVEIGLMLRLTR